MSNRLEGGPAFPQPGVNVPEHVVDFPEPGMSLRQYIATHALAALIASPDTPPVERTKIAKWAWGYADALLATEGE